MHSSCIFLAFSFIILHGAMPCSTLPEQSRWGGKQQKQPKGVGLSYTFWRILHPILHPKFPVNTEHSAPGCRKCRRFHENFYGACYGRLMRWTTSWQIAKRIMDCRTRPLAGRFPTVRGHPWFSVWNLYEFILCWMCIPWLTWCLSSYLWWQGNILLVRGLRCLWWRSFLHISCSSLQQKHPH